MPTRLLTRRIDVLVADSCAPSKTAAALLLRAPGLSPPPALLILRCFSHMARAALVRAGSTPGFGLGLLRRGGFLLEFTKSPAFSPLGLIVTALRIAVTRGPASCAPRLTLLLSADFGLVLTRCSTLSASSFLRDPFVLSGLLLSPPRATGRALSLPFSILWVNVIILTGPARTLGPSVKPGLVVSGLVSMSPARFGARLSTWR